MEPFFASLQGNEIYFYTNKNDKVHKYMLNLTSCFIKTDEQEQKQSKFHMLSIAIPANKSKDIYFDSLSQHSMWTQAL